MQREITQFLSPVADAAIESMLMLPSILCICIITYYVKMHALCSVLLSSGANGDEN